MSAKHTHCLRCDTPLGSRNTSGYCRYHVSANAHPQRAQGAATRARVAELMAEHGTFAEVARHMGVSEQRVSQIWTKVLQEMEG